jgi:hypothetical protein
MSGPGEDAEVAPSGAAYRHCLQAGALLQLAPDSGAIIRCHKPLGTKIVQFQPRNSGIIVQEEYYGFPRGQSNLYLVDYAFMLIWRAELPGSHDIYVNGFIDRGDCIQCSSWECFMCGICPKTGKILSRQFTK